MSGSSTFRGRQSAVRIFAQEYSESSLIERGVGEYDPSFVITKLGAKVNRCLVCGGPVSYTHLTLPTIYSV